MEDRISDLEDRNFEITQSRVNRKKKKEKSEENL